MTGSARRTTRVSTDIGEEWMENSRAPSLDDTGHVVAFGSRHPINGGDEAATKTSTYTGCDKVFDFGGTVRPSEARGLEAEIQLVRLHPRYAPLVVDGLFGLPMVIDGPGEVDRLDAVIEQIDAALQRLSSNEALQEVRGAIREYPGFGEAPHARWTTSPLIKARRQDSLSSGSDHAAVWSRRPCRTLATKTSPSWR